ncbi:MAG: DUF4412 domain-containing protein [Firmicutes bacterium]|nr:DUF4412 domain-containing protein [Bacillota bacterium]
MKQIIRLLFLVVMTFLLLTGCGGDTNTAGEGKSSGEPPKQEANKQSGDNLTSLFANAKGIKAISYNMVMSLDGQLLSQGRVWVKGEKTKMEFNAEGMNAIMYVDMSEQVAYNYLPSEQMAMKTDFSQAKSQIKGSPLEYSKEYSSNNKYEKIGTEQVNGYTCEGIVLDENGEPVTVWVSKDYGIPVKVESIIDGKKATIDFSDIKVGDIPDSDFELPPGVEVMDMNQMMGDFPNMQE